MTHKGRFFFIFFLFTLSVVAGLCTGHICIEGESGYSRRHHLVLRRFYYPFWPVGWRSFAEPMDFPCIQGGGFATNVFADSEDLIDYTFLVADYSSHSPFACCRIFRNSSMLKSLREIEDNLCWSDKQRRDDVRKTVFALADDAGSRPSRTMENFVYKEIYQIPYED